MSQAHGGWVLELRCTGCGTSDKFRGPVLSLVGEVARKAGWDVASDLPVLNRQPGTRDELCPDCVASLAG